MGDDLLDRDLLVRWAGGDIEAGDELTTAYFDPIRNYFFRRAPEEYEDLSQQTFLELAKSRARYRGEGTVRSFIFAIARHQHLQHLRNVRRQLDFDQLTTSLYEVHGRRPSSLLAAREEQQMILDALQEIPVAAQDMLELRYWENLSTAELAQVMGIAEGTVYSRTHRAINALRERFELVRERGPSPTDQELIDWIIEVGAQVW